jgi:hypothetical protein
MGRFLVSSPNRSRCGVRVPARQKRARKELAILLLVEPRAFDIEESQARELSEREGVDHELGNRMVGTGAGLVV